MIILLLNYLYKNAIINLTLLVNNIFGNLEIDLMNLILLIGSHFI
jgi:hypothetical protein